MAEDAKERVLRYLNDAHAAEEGGLASMRDVAAQATNSDVRAAITEHLAVSQSQADRLEARIIALGGHKNAAKNIVNTIISKGSNFLNAFHDDEDKTTQDVIKMVAFEHFEVGTYTALKAYASAVGDHETAQLAESIIGEEQLAAERLQRLIPIVAISAVRKTDTANATV